MFHFYSSLSMPSYVTVLAVGIALCIYGTIRYKGWRWLSISGVVMGIFMIATRLIQSSDKLSVLHQPVRLATEIVCICFIAYIFIGFGIVRYKQINNQNNPHKK